MRIVRTTKDKFIPKRGRILGITKQSRSAGNPEKHRPIEKMHREKQEVAYYSSHCSIPSFPGESEAKAPMGAPGIKEQGPVFKVCIRSGGKVELTGIAMACGVSVLLLLTLLAGWVCSRQ